MKFNLWKIEYLVYCGCNYGEYSPRYVVVTKPLSQLEAESLICGQLEEGEELEEIYTPKVCIGVGTYGQLLWGKAND